MEQAVTYLHIISVAVLAAGMTYAAISDLRTFEVPNWTSGLIVITFLIVALTNSVPWSALQWNIWTALVVLIVGFMLFAANFLGAGDVKLLAAIALWIGWPLFISYLAIVALAGGILALVLMVFRRFPLPARLAATPWIEQLYTRRKDVPYAVAIGIITLFFIPRIPIVAEIWLRLD